jgi:FkbM family methyltransferase
MSSLAFSTHCKHLLLSLGLEVRRLQKVPGDYRRPVGAIKPFLEDLQARGLSPKTTLDVGALTGEWTLMASSVFPDCNFLMIEPQERMEPHLKKLADSSSRFRYVLAGAGRESGTMVLNLGNDPASSTFLQEGEGDLCPSPTRVVTKIETLDEIVRASGWSTPDLVKLDVQGFELEALSGAEKLFGVTELFILETSLFRFSEGMPITRDCIHFMNQRGYELYDITEFRRRPFDGALGQVDLAFARANGFLRRSNTWK